MNIWEILLGILMLITGVLFGYFCFKNRTTKKNESENFGVMSGERIFDYKGYMAAIGFIIMGIIFIVKGVLEG